MSSRRLIRIGDCGRGGREGRLLTGYLLGALPTSITCGLLLVFAPPGSGTSIMAKHGVNPVLNIVVGALILFGKGSARDTFIVGILLSFPGGTYIAEMNLLSKQNTGTAVSGRGANILVLDPTIGDHDHERTRSERRFAATAPPFGERIAP